MIDLPPLTYLSVDSLQEGVGASQVLPYVEALSWQGMTVRLHSLEKGRPSPAIGDRLEAAGVSWHPHPWGQGGPTAGLARLVRGATYLRSAELVHARSDIPAGSALLARRPTWIWDMRGFWADERIELGLLRPGSPEERFMRWIEAPRGQEGGSDRDAHGRGYRRARTAPRPVDPRQVRGHHHLRGAESISRLGDATRRAAEPRPGGNPEPDATTFR